MSDKNASLNPPQMQLLSWVREGCPDGVYNDWSHRISARALHNRGFIVVKGRGAAWFAMITANGLQLLDHDTFQPDTVNPTESTTDKGKQSPVSTLPTSEPILQSSVTTQKSISPKTKMPGPMDQMMAALHEAEGHRLLIASAHESRYRQLAGAAKRFGRIPDGMQISFTWTENRQYALALEPLPAWQTKVLEPIPVPRHLHDPSSIVVALMESDTFRVVGSPRKRALRLAEAIVSQAQERGMVLDVLLNQPVNRDNYRRDSPRHDEIELRVGQDHFRLWFTQATLQIPHQPTKREISRVQHGFLFPDFDDVPDEKLGIVLDGKGEPFWASAWKDREDHRLEDDLAQILEEIWLRHQRLVEQRRVDQEKYEARQRALEDDRVRAMTKYHKHFVIEAMKKQAEDWERAVLLRKYAEAVRAEAEGVEDDERDQARSWALQIEAQAEIYDPLPDAAKIPEIPEPSDSDLAKFMSSRGTYSW